MDYEWQFQVRIVDCEWKFQAMAGAGDWSSIDEEKGKYLVVAGA